MILATIKNRYTGAHQEQTLCNTVTVRYGMIVGMRRNPRKGQPDYLVWGVNARDWTLVKTEPAE